MLSILSQAALPISPRAEMMSGSNFKINFKTLTTFSIPVIFWVVGIFPSHNVHTSIVLFMCCSFAIQAGPTRSRLTQAKVMQKVSRKTHVIFHL